MRSGKRAGFTMIELMVAMTILAIILSLALPRYFSNLDASKESVLREDLFVLRDAIDKYFVDNGKYPASLEELQTRRYIRKLPADPFTRSEQSWAVTPPADSGLGAVYDVHSGAPGKSRDGTLYKDW